MTESETNEISEVILDLLEDADETFKKEEVMAELHAGGVGDRDDR